MKKFLKIAEITLLSTLLIATFMRLFEMAGGGILTVLSLNGLTLLYLIFGFSIFSNIQFKKKSNEESTKKQNPIFVVVGVIIGIVASFSCLGTLFKVMFWQGSGVLLATGTIAFAFFLLGFVVLKIIIKENNTFFGKMIIRLGLFFFVISSLYSIPTTTLVDILYRKQPKYAEMMKQSIANPEDEEIRIKMDMYRDSLENSKYSNR